jgi:four helix bundle protein
MTQTPVQSYRDLRVWQEGISFAKKVYKVSQVFPPQERFGLISQMRRAAISIPSNIAEGHARIGTREYLHFLSIAMGSVAELDTQIILCRELEFLSPQDSQEMIRQLETIGKMLRRLYQALDSPRVGDSTNQAVPFESELALSEEQETWDIGTPRARTL